jgi:hypothetical protein
MGRARYDAEWPGRPHTHGALGKPKDNRVAVVVIAVQCREYARCLYRYARQNQLMPRSVAGSFTQRSQLLRTTIISDLTSLPQSRLLRKRSRHVAGLDSARSAPTRSLTVRAADRARLQRESDYNVISMR